MSGEDPNFNNQGEDPSLNNSHEDDFLGRLREYTTTEGATAAGPEPSKPYSPNWSESLGSITNAVVTPGQNVQLSENGYNTSPEKVAAENVVETAKKQGEASLRLQEVEARIKGNTGASTLVMNAAISAIGGLKKFAESRSNANAEAARRDMEKWNKSSYTTKVARQSEKVGQRASQFITLQGNAARTKEQSSQVGQDNLLGRTSAGANELFKRISNNQLERSIGKSERLENRLAARRWRGLLAKEERHIGRAKFYQNLAKTLDFVMGLFANHGDQSMEAIARQRRYSLENDRVARAGEREQANQQYGEALQGQMNASYSGK